MASKRSISATLVLKAGDFFANVRKAQAAATGLKGKLQALTGQNSKLNSSNRAVGSGFTDVAKKIAVAAGAVVSFGKVKDVVADSVIGVMELERANTRLETLMMNVQGTTKEQVQSLIDYGDALELCTTIEGDATMAGASQLATFQLSYDTIRTLLPSFQDLAVAQYGVNVTQEQMIQSGNLIGKVMNGSTGALTKAGVSFTEAQEKILKTGTESQKAAALVEVLQKNFGGLSTQMAQTDEGRIRQLKNAWGSVKDEIGFALMPAVSGMVQYFSDRIPQIRDTVTNTLQGIKDKIPSVTEKVQTILDYIPKIVSFVQNDLPKYAPAIKIIGAAILLVKGYLTATTMVQTALNAVASISPFGWIMIAVTGIVLLWKNCETFRNAVKTVWQAVQPTIQAIANAFKQAWELIKVVWNAVSPYFQIVWSNILSGLNVVKTFISGAFNTSWELIKLVWNAAAGYFTAVWNSIAAVFSVVRNVLTGNWQGAWDGIKGIVDTWSGYFNNIWESIKNVFSSVKTWFADTFSAAGDAIKNSIVRSVNGAISIANKIPGVNIPTIGNVPGLATGGVIQRSGTVWVGERGPELLTLPRGAQVTPLDKAGGGNTINIYVTGGGSADGTVNEIVTKLKLALANL